MTKEQIMTIINAVLTCISTIAAAILASSCIAHV